MPLQTYGIGIDDDLCFGRHGCEVIVMLSYLRDNGGGGWTGGLVCVLQFKLCDAEAVPGRRNAVANWT